MSDFVKKFLIEDPRRLSPNGRYVALAAFGKHPGWDDHVEDLGLETESLNLAKTIFYVNGIGGQIDSGAWEKLDAAQLLPAFKHVFVWQRSGQILVGRLWSSSDGKGRKRYPMVVCVHFTGVTLGWALKQALPTLAELEEGCLKATTAEEVRTLLSRKRAALREAIQSTDGGGEYAPVLPEALHKILQTGGNVQPEGFLRVLYQIENQSTTFIASRSGANANPVEIRVPLAGENPEQALLFWTRFFQTQLDAAAPLLLMLPLDAEWVDVVAGEPGAHEFFYLRASPKAVPLVSEVPYKLDDAFRAKASAFLAGFQRGEKAAAMLPPAAPAAIAPAPAKSGWLKWLVIGGVVIALAVVVFMLKGGKPSPGTNEVATKAEVVKNGVATLPETNDAAKAAAAHAKLSKDAATESARLAEEKKAAEAMAAAVKLKTETEAAAKEQERKLAEAARLEKEKELARQNALEEQRKAAAAAAQKKAEEQIVTATNPITANPAGVPVKPVATAPGEMTNSIGMVLLQVSPEMWVGKYEVTQGEYEKVMESDAGKPGNKRQPVVRVSWHEATNFCGKLTQLERGALKDGRVYTLPTEKQWKEFAGRQRFEDIPGGVAGRAGPSVVGQSSPANEFGLFDVLGNVWEWCLDDTTGDQKLLKGGAFNGAFYDKSLPPDKQVSNCGFRCVVVSR